MIRERWPSRRLLLGAAGSAALLALMAAGCLFLWVGVPLGWLWIASQLQEELPVGTSLLLMMVGAVATIALVAPMLSWLDRVHHESRAARGLPVADSSPLEVMLVVSAALAAVGVAVWFLALSGSSPMPLTSP